MWGCLVAIYYQQLWNWISIFIKKYKFSILIPFAGFFVSVVMPKFFPADDMFAGGIVRALGRADGTITNMFICLIIVIVVNVKDNRLYDCLNSKPVNYIGKISYSLYIWQELFFSNHIGILGIFPLNIFCIIVVAGVSYHIIEKPFLTLKSKFAVEKNRDMFSIGREKSEAIGLSRVI
jgi:peptidoglycan/LPS O-acetylase OafA/YrhL